MVTAASRAALVARGAAVVSVVSAVAAVVMVTVDEAWGFTPAPQMAVDAAVGISYPLIGVVVLTARDLPRGTRQLVGVLMVAGVCSGLAALGTAGALVADAQDPMVALVVQMQAWLWVPGFLPLLTLLPLLYPDGLLPGRPWRAAAVLSWTGIGILAAGAALVDETFPGRLPLQRSFTADAVGRALFVLGAVLLVPALLLALVSLVVRWRSADRLRRRQVAVLVAAAAVLLVVTALQGVLPSPLDVLLQAVAVVLVPVAIGVAVTRDRLYELDTAVRRTLTVGSLTVCLAGLYLTLFAPPTAGPGLLGRCLRGRCGDHRRAGAAAGATSDDRGRPAVLRRPRGPVRRVEEAVRATGGDRPRRRRGAPRRLRDAGELAASRGRRGVVGGRRRRQSGGTSRR
jgi:hypothetical protein